MTFTIVGAGNIAWFIGTRLVAAGHNCLGVYSRTVASAQLLSAELGAPCSADLRTLTTMNADCCLLAVPDTAIAEVARSITPCADTVVIHAAGAVPIDAITNASRHCGVFWTIYSIARMQLPQHRDIPVAWEATTPHAREVVTAMAAAVTDAAFEAGYEQRKWLHLTAVIGNNFTNHLLAACEQVCADHQLPFSIVMPIIRQTFDRIATTSPRMVQTGPAIRRDETTIADQQAMLATYPEWQRMYAAITASIQQMGRTTVTKE